MNKHILVIALSTVLVACGGGGGSSSTPAPTPTTPTTPPSEVTIVGTQSASVNQPVGLVAMLPDGQSGEAFDFSWTQTSGPTVNALATHSQVIGFDVKEAGDYSFQVEVTDSSGSVVTQNTFDFTASGEIKNAGVRLDHAVVEQGKVSLKADALPEYAIPNVTWTQIAGPTISTADLTIDEDENLLFFDAPAVNTDTLFQFEARIQLAETGEIITDEVSVLVKDATINSNGYFPSEDIIGRVVYNEMHAYRPGSAYANALESCVYNNTLDNSCSFANLPLIGKVNSNPTVENVLDRLLVSHDWMGDRFKEYLETSVAAQDMLLLLKGVTAVVISYEVRPSFYWSATGAIYLDANNFWVYPEERDTLNDQPDFRSNFGNDLQFIMPWRYVRNGQNYLNRGSYPVEQRLSRSFEDVEADITWLMYHELAHANDFFPPSTHAGMATNTSPLAFSNSNPPTSNTFSQIYPLLSQELVNLAQVSFRGETANNTQKAYQASDIQQFFEPDSAAMYYSFSTTREDYATLFERFMMAYRFGAESDVAVLSRVNNPEFVVTWGQRHRINDPKLIERTKYTVENILPSLDADAIQATFNSPQLMTPGVSWFDNLIGSDKAGNIKQSGAVRAEDIQQYLRYPHMHLHHIQ